MRHVLIGYDALVLMIGFAALTFSVHHARRIRQRSAVYFCAVYLLFTVVIALTVSESYLLVNVQAVGLRSIFTIRGARVVSHFLLIYAAILYYQEQLAVRWKSAVGVGLLFPTIFCVALLLLPGGAVLDEPGRRILLGTGYFVAAACALLLFTYAISLGIAAVVRSSPHRGFLLGLLAFAGVGYAETTGSFVAGLASGFDVLSAGRGGFMVSSVPYALYGIFLIVFFARSAGAPGSDAVGISREFRTRSGLTAREEEIVLLVLRGRTNAEIAAALFISLATVKTHLHNVFRKAGVRSRYGLIWRARAM